MTSTPVAAAATAPRWRAADIARAWLPQLGWTIVSVRLFAAIWELCWYVGWVDPRLIPAPHIFLSDLTRQAKFFNTAQRWQIGVDCRAEPGNGRADHDPVLDDAGVRRPWTRHGRRHQPGCGGIGNGPAIFMVFIVLFFHMIPATITQIDRVNRNYINLGRTSTWQIYRRVILPAILPGLLVVIRSPCSAPGWSS